MPVLVDLFFQRGSALTVAARDQAILVLRWFLDGSLTGQLARDNEVSVFTGYGYLYGGTDVLAARSPTLHGALLAAKATG